jgi:hypothetical protein
MTTPIDQPRAIKARLCNRWRCSVGNASRNFNPPPRLDAPSPAVPVLERSVLKKEQHIMAFGFPAYHTEHYSADAGMSADLNVVARSALKAMSWSIRTESDGQIVASTSVNLRSWAEEVLISFLPDNSISVTSKCSWPTQCFDWGKNKANVEKFMAEIKRHA